MDAEESAEPVERPKPKVPTIVFWAIGIALQLAAPLLRDRVPLSDELLINSILMPVWTFLQVCLLAGLLRLLRKQSEGWSPSRRTTYGVVAAAAFMLLQPGTIEVLFGISDLGRDHLKAALLWSSPLAFYVVPAFFVVWEWLRRGRPAAALRTLGIGLIFIGVVNFPFILWLTHLWRIYVNTQGGGQVLLRMLSGT